MVLSSSSIEAAAVPVDFPLPSHHPWIRLSGLQMWFRGIAREESVVFHKFLLSFDVDQASPSPSLYLGPVQTSLAVAVYDMACGRSRALFDQVVRWEGIEDVKPVPDVPSIISAFGSLVGWDDGVVPSEEARNSKSSLSFDCYKCLFRDSATTDVVSRLGVNPWASAVAAALLEEPGVWATGKFSVTVGLPQGPAPKGSQDFLQAHVVKSPDGVSIKQLIPYLTGMMRLGATDLAAALSIAEQSEAPAARQVFDLRPRGPSHRMTFAVYGIIGADTKKYPSIAFTPLTSPALAIMLGVYESVRLESARFTITVDKGSGNSVWCAMVSAGTTLSTVDDWYSAPVMAQVDGSDTGVVRGLFEMPTVTMFSREYRATTLGNPPSKFVFAYTGAAETNGTIQGVFTVDVSGQRLMSRVNIGGGNALTSVKNLVSTIQGELDYDVDDCDLAPFGNSGSSIVPVDAGDES